MNISKYILILIIAFGSVLTVKALPYNENRNSLMANTATNLEKIACQTAPSEQCEKVKNICLQDIKNIITFSQQKNDICLFSASIKRSQSCSALGRHDSLFKVVLDTTTTFISASCNEAK